LNDYTSDYKTCLLKLKLLLLMYTLDINDIIFLIKSIKFPSNSFNIKDFVTFISGNTWLANNHKLQHTRSSYVLSNNFYFNRIARIWNVLPVVDCNLNIPTIKFHLIQNSPAVKKVCGPQEGHCKKRCEIQGGSQEMAWW